MDKVLKLKRYNEMMAEYSKLSMVSSELFEKLKVEFNSIKGIENMDNEAQIKHLKACKTYEQSRKAHNDVCDKWQEIKNYCLANGLSSLVEDDE